LSADCLGKSDYGATKKTPEARNYNDINSVPVAQVDRATVS